MRISLPHGDAGGGFGAESSPSRDLLSRVHMDGPLSLALLTAAVLGLVVLYSAGQENIGLVERQSVRLALSFMVMIVLAQVPSHQLQVWTPWLYLGGIVMLVAVLLVGETSKGAQRWLDVGVRFQPQRS